MVKLGVMLTIYICLSFILFLATSFTITGWIAYQFLLLPFYAVVLLGWWFFVWLNRTKTARIRCWIWSIVLALQVATILVAPGNCYGLKEGARCYSNLQILIGNVPSTGPSNSLHWELVEDAFLGLLAAYGVSLVVGLSGTSVAKSINNVKHRK